jgi:hypothetical protein
MELAGIWTQNVSKRNPETAKGGFKGPAGKGFETLDALQASKIQA